MRFALIYILAVMLLIQGQARAEKSSAEAPVEEGPVEEGPVEQAVAQQPGVTESPAQEPAITEATAGDPGLAAIASTESSDAVMLPGINLEGILEPDAPLASDALDAGALEFQEQDNPTLVAPDVSSYLFYITDLESRGGAYAQGLSEQLLGLGMAYHNQGLYKEAVKAFKRGVHLARINNGLYSQEQIPILQRQIASHVAAGEYSEADERQYYLYRVQRKVYQRDRGALSLAMLERAEWERQAYYLSVGEASFTRLLTMWQLYWAVLDNISQAEGTYSDSLVQPLRGLLQTQYLIAGYEKEAPKGFEINGGNGEQNTIEKNRFQMLQNSNYRQGQEVITALRDVYVYNEGEGSLAAALALLELGDWHMRYKKLNDAQASYAEAWQALSVRDDGEALLAQHFGVPIMLPTTPGAHADIEPPANVSGYATVRYGVNARGRMYGLKLLEKEMVSEEASKSPVRLMRRIKVKTFRPRYENGEPVATEEIVKQYAF